MKKIISFLIVIFCLVVWLVQAKVEIKNASGFIEGINAIALKNHFLDPELIGPDKLCNIVGSIRGTFSGGGNPETDVYKWTILAPNGQVLFTRPPGAFQSIEYTFELIGLHKVLLEVSRGGILIGKFIKNVEIINGPNLSLLNSYQICNGQKLSVKAISESSSDFSNYTFTWTDESNTIVGKSNELFISKPGKYNVEFFVLDSQQNPQCQTFLATNVTLLEEITIIKSSDNVCKDKSINFETNPITVGKWVLTIPGSSEPVFIRESSQLTLFPILDLPEFGQYEIKLIVQNPNNPLCAPEAITTFNYNEDPIIEIKNAVGASDCFSPDGSLVLTALTNIDQLYIDGSGTTYGPFNSGNDINIPNLQSGAYTIFTSLGGCINSFGTVVPLETPPTNLEFKVENITSESCSETGKISGSFDINLVNGPTQGSYRVISERGDELIKDALPIENPFRISLGGGKYFFEILDKDSCNLPNKEFIEIPSKSQTSFDVPNRLVICQSYDLLPFSTENLIYTLIDPTGNMTTRLSGDPFIITENGEYELIGTLPDQNEYCPSSKRILVTSIDPIKFDPILKSEDCVIGNRIYTAEIYDTDSTLVNYFWRNELGENIGTGKNLFLSPTSIGTFSLEVQPKNSESCPIPPIKFEVQAPILFVDASIKSTKLCELGPEAIVELSTSAPEVVKFIEWRRFNEFGEIVELPEFNNKLNFSTRIGGTYEASVFSAIKPGINTRCELARVNFELDLTSEKVDFDIPSNLSICESYSFTPTTTQSLVFEVTQPDGSIKNLVTGESILLDQTGIYSFLGFDQDINGPQCPELKQLNVQVNQKISFMPVFFEETCQGTKTYKAEIGTIDPSTAIFSWFDNSGNLIGTDQFLKLSSFGQFSLDVQPAGSIPCDQTPIFFEVEAPLLSQEVNLLAGPLCPDADFAIIEADTEFENITQIQWWFTNLSGAQSQLISELNKQSISARSEGTYEVRILNSIGCQLGFDRVLVMRSMDSVRPVVEESYKVCPRYEIGPNINPGNFIAYEWYLDNQLVSTNPSYKPTLPGNYTLIVESAEGCTYSTNFLTEEECELRVSYPNAIQPGNPDKEFLIYTNFLVDKLKVSIFNRWGELIYFCEKTDLITSESACIWDGTYKGKAIPNGSYAVRIDLENFEKKITKIQNGFILVIE